MIGWSPRRALAAMLLIVGAGMLPGCVDEPSPGAGGPSPADGTTHGSVDLEGGWVGGSYGGNPAGTYRGGGASGHFQGENWGGGFRSGY